MKIIFCLICNGAGKIPKAPRESYSADCEKVICPGCRGTGRMMFMDDVHEVPKATDGNK
jgi:DnaJ-class molecular chaperone